VTRSAGLASGSETGASRATEALPVAPANWELELSPKAGQSMAGFAGCAIAQEASVVGLKRHYALQQLLLPCREKRSDTGRAKRAAFAGDGERTLTETTQRGSRAPPPTWEHEMKRTRKRSALSGLRRVRVL